MTGSKCNISFIIVLVSLFSIRAFPQQKNTGDSIPGYYSAKVNLKPRLNYMIGSNFLVFPHVGSITAFTISPSLSIPLAPKLTVNGGVIAGYFYSAPWNSNNEGAVYGSFNELAVYGSARYHFNSQLTLYGAGIKQLAGISPFNSLPKSSYAIGSTYNFGSFSIGVALQMSNWNTFSSFPVNGSEGFFSPYEQRHGTFGTFGQ